VSTQSQNGKAFEWSVAKAIADETGFSILDSKSTRLAQSAFHQEKFILITLNFSIETNKVSSYDK
jgi:vancomycin permeability regulator SanA